MPTTTVRLLTATWAKMGKRTPMKPQKDDPQRLCCPYCQIKLPLFPVVGVTLRVVSDGLFKLKCRSKQCKPNNRWLHIGTESVQ